MEIERQFLVKKLPVLPDVYEYLEQGYVSLVPEIRIRKIGDNHYMLTVKRGVGLVREEWETDISRQEYENLVAQLYPETQMIVKHRYHIRLEDGHIAELHIHSGHLAGFSYVEVEFSDVEDAKAFVPPDWFGREVTDDAEFTYGALAKANGMELVQRLLLEQS